MLSTFKVYVTFGRYKHKVYIYRLPVIINMTKYGILLPEILPGIIRDNYDVRAEYSSIEKIAVTEAVSPKDALNHVIFRSVKNKKLGRIISVLISNNDKYEIYEIPIVENELGTKLTLRDKNYYESEILTIEMASSRRQSEDKCRSIARKLVEMGNK